MDSTVIRAPWTPDQVEALNRYQHLGHYHAYTCGGDRSDAAHVTYQAEHGGDHGQLVATADGWICPVCGYRQDWAHAFSFEELPDPAAILRQAAIAPAGKVVQFPKRPNEWDELFSVSIARNGQIFVTAPDGTQIPETLVWAMSDLCKRVIASASWPPRNGPTNDIVPS